MKDFKTEFAAIKTEYENGAHVREFEELKARLSEKVVVLFGAAWIGDFFYHRLISSGVSIECFVDNYATGVTPAGYSPIIDASELKEKYPNATVIISCDKARDIIYSQLLELGYVPEQIIKYPRQLCATMDIKEFWQYLDGYEEAYNFFNDETSKKVIIDRIRCYLFGENMQKSDCPQYFEKDIIHLAVDEIFVDGGFFTGDTSEEFIRQTNNKYTRIYGFEPDKYVIDKIKSDIRNSSRIEVISEGLYREKSELRFASTGGTSQASGGNIVTEDGKNVSIVPVTSLDELFSGKSIDEYPTYIKLDIEGAERDALLGMRNVIRRSKPKLAICAYHKPEDIYDLYRLICEFRNDYQFYLRHYANYFWETVLYAV